MKATISYGDVTVDVSEAVPGEVRDLIFALKDGPSRSTVPQRELKKKARGRPQETETVADLNASQLQTWQYLTAHDNDKGVSATDYAKDASIAHPVADNRLRKLLSLGMAYKVAPGRYRPGGGT